MKKVLVGYFTCESNENVPLKSDINNFIISFGDDVVKQSRIEEIFKQEYVEVIPSIYASAGAAGVITRNCFEYIESCFVKAINEHINEIDGIWLHLHGASYVEDGIGSGDHHILKTVRQLVGPYIPIVVTCDPHGNLTKEYVEECTVIRSYRESPHTDADETKCYTAKLLCDLLKNRQNIHPIYRKLPLILGGEQSVSTDEPVLSINKYMDEMEKDSHVLSASWHVGYIRHDCPEAGCGIVVVPASEEDQEYCEQKANELAKYVWDKHHEFHYTGLSLEPEIAIKQALEFNDKPTFITDSGDNVTSGATGWNTFILRQALAAKTNKSFLFANITDPIAYDKLFKLDIGASTNISLGMNYDENSESVPLSVTVKAKGYLRGYLMHVHDAVYGYSILVHVEGTNIDINIATTRQTMCEKHQFDACGINWDDYDIIVVKQGYAFPEIKEKGKLVIMSLTNGSTLQDTSKLPFKRIMRPMYPIDKI